MGLPGFLAAALKNAFSSFRQKPSVNCCRRMTDVGTDLLYDIVNCNSLTAIFILCIFCFLFCVFCVCVLFLLTYIVVSFLFVYKFTDHCHRGGLINIMSYHIIPYLLSPSDSSEESYSFMGIFIRLSHEGLAFHQHFVERSLTICLHGGYAPPSICATY